MPPTYLPTETRRTLTQQQCDDHTAFLFLVRIYASHSVNPVSTPCTVYRDHIKLVNTPSASGHRRSASGRWPRHVGHHVPIDAMIVPTPSQCHTRQFLRSDVQSPAYHASTSGSAMKRARYWTTTGYGSRHSFGTWSTPPEHRRLSTGTSAQSAIVGLACGQR